MDRETVKRIVLEIALMGQEGLDYSSPEEKYRLKTLPDQAISGLQLMCLMYAGMKMVMPDTDPGMDLEKEYRQAMGLWEAKG